MASSVNDISEEASSHNATGMFGVRKCVGCGIRMAEDELFVCADCANHLPLSYEWLTPSDNPTARLLWGKCHLERAVAGFLNQSHSSVSRMIYSLKYHGNMELGEWLGSFLAKEMMASGFFDGIDIIMPLPLHPRREQERGYNQSRAFAEGLARVTQLPLCDDAVARVRNTPSQATLTPDKRAGNMVGAFSVTHAEEIAWHHVLLVDDVITTGSSLASCASEMTKVEGVRVSMLAIGRTVI